MSIQAQSAHQTGQPDPSGFYRPISPDSSLTDLMLALLSADPACDAWFRELGSSAQAWTLGTRVPAQTLADLLVRRRDHPLTPDQRLGLARLIISHPDKFRQSVTVCEHSTTLVACAQAVQEAIISQAAHPTGQPISHSP